MKLTVHPATPDRWPDVEAVFEAKGCSVARGCWCMFYRERGAPPPPPPGKTTAGVRRAALKRLTRKDPPPGLVGYRDGAPVGWVSLGPREDFKRLEHSPVMKPVDDQAVWSIVCFVVPAAERGNGVAKALLAGAIAYARSQGVKLLEAYPVDRTTRGADDSLWFGVQSMYEEAGFEEVARRKPKRPVMRLRLGSRSSRSTKKV